MDERTAEGVEHLQAAARELLGAARAFLDVVEEVVEDSDRLSGAAGAVSDLVRNGFGLVGRHEPWHDVASRGEDGDDLSTSARTASWWNEPYGDTDAAAETPAEALADDESDGDGGPTGEAPAEDDGAAPGPEGGTEARPALAPATAKRSGRVRRIAVD